MAPPPNSLLSNARAPPPPRLLLINKFAESRAPELESLHSIVSARLNHDFRMRRDKRRRTAGFQSGKNRRRKRPRLIDGQTGSKAELPRESKPSRRVRRRLELRRNLASGFSVSGDGTKRLRTHLWHAKRFSMVKRWGFYLPLGLHGRGRGSRAVLKLLKSGALIHDASYTHPVQLEGPEESILAIMRMVLRPFPSEQMSKPVVYGACYAESMLYHSRSPFLEFIAPVIYMWLPLKRDEIYMNSVQVDGCSSSSRSACNSLLRKLWIWLHPASYDEGFDALSCACQKSMNETGVPVHCLSLEGNIAKLEVIGAESLKILQKILIPLAEGCKNDSSSTLSGSSLRACSNSRPTNFVLENADRLPCRAIFSLEVQDPRNLPASKTKCFPTTELSEESIGNKDLFFSTWSKPEANGVFLSECRHLWDSYINLKPPLPENVICNERHCKLLKQFYLDSTIVGEQSANRRDEFDQTCPIMLLRHADNGMFNSGWSIILPLSWVKPFWMCLISNRARAIGLRERRWIACNGGLPSFLCDFPDSNACSSFMTEEAAKAYDAAKLRPPAVRPVDVPFAPQWHTVAHTLHRRFNIKESFNIDSRDGQQFSYEHAGESFKVSILRTSNDLNRALENDCGEGHQSRCGGPLFVRVLIHAFKEGSFEEAAVICAPELADLPSWLSRSEEHAPLQMPDSFIKSYFTRQDSNTWELHVPTDNSMLQWYRWPIGFITTGFVRGCSKPVAIAFCEARILKRLKEDQKRAIDLNIPEIFVLVRNLKSSTYRRAVATLSLDLHDEDLAFM